MNEVPSYINKSAVPSYITNEFSAKKSQISRMDLRQELENKKD